MWQQTGDDVTPSDTDTDPGVLTILLADDDPFLRDVVGAKLRTCGYNVTEAGSGDEALPLLQRRGFDVLVTDISMPGALDGWLLADQARGIHPDIALIYVSSGPQDAERQVSGSLYLRKPLDLDDLVTAVRQLASRRGVP